MKRVKRRTMSALAMVLVFAAVHLATGMTVASGQVRPANDECERALPVGSVKLLAFDTSNATFDGPGHFLNTPNVWYCYTATCSGLATFSLAGSEFDTMMAVYDGCGCYPRLIDLIRGNDDFHVQESQIAMEVAAGNRYLIEIGGFNSNDKGRGVLSIDCAGQACEQQNDNCGKAEAVGDVKDMLFDTTCATFDGPGQCMRSPNIWYRYTAQGTGQVTVSLAGSLFDTMLAVYEGGTCLPRLSALIECNDDFADSLTSQVTFPVTAGTVYLIEIGGFEADEIGRGVLNIVSDVIVPLPPKDDCINAIAIGDVSNLPFDTTNATFDGPGHCTQGPNIWYCYTATCTGDATVSLIGSSFDTMLAVYEGCGCDPSIADMIECNDDAQGGFQSEVTFAAVAGRRYLIEIGGYGSANGQGVLNVACQGDPGPPPAKDDCAGARPVGNVVNLPFDTTNAVFDGPGLCMTSPNTWYCYTATCTGRVTVSLLGSAFDTMLAAYKGCNCDLAAQDLIACNDDFGTVFQSEISFDAVRGNRYLIEVGGYAVETGRGVLSISCEPAASPEKPDLGDAPDSTNNSGKIMGAYPSPPSIPANFPTVFDDGTGVGPHGPVHLNQQPVAYLGTAVTAETEADNGPDEDGINNLIAAVNSSNNDGGDDAVELPLALPDCGWATIDYKVTVIEPGADLWVNIWLDFNRDGDWDDEADCPAGAAKEWAVQNQFLFDLPAGLSQITTPAFLSAHREDRADEIWMRITLSERPWIGGSNPGEPGNAGSGPADKYQIGETEDYFFVPQTGSGECPLCEDVNGDGVIDMDDLAAFVSKWLANCR